MLNAYKVTPRVDARTTNNNTLNFDAVSGTICKSHPKSVLVWFQHGSQIAEQLMCANPSYAFSEKKEDCWTDENGKYHFDQPRRVPVVVLQAMLTGENRVIAEIVKRDEWIQEESDD